jgi:hypothetical protein
MTYKPKRPWFQFHLLTAVLITITSGAFVAANFSPTKQFHERGHAHNFNPLNIVHAYGWPMRAAEKWYDVFGYGLDSQVVELHEKLSSNSSVRAVVDDYEKHFETEELGTKWSASGIAADAGTLLSVITMVAFVSEALIRRREGRKQ